MKKTYLNLRNVSYELSIGYGKYINIPYGLVELDSEIAEKHPALFKEIIINDIKQDEIQVKPEDTSHNIKDIIDDHIIQETIMSAVNQDDEIKTIEEPVIEKKKRRSPRKKTK